ncbi:MAG TPA: helix-turn-helix domain-containing protein [Gemmatimonadota bacterium]|nr:helix-turn-helix domain-containing protein [Gemmatimonadota bacterium]
MIDRRAGNGPEGLPSGTKREVLDLLVRGPLAAADLAQRLGVTSAAVRQHLSVLAEAGLVERARSGSGAGRPAYLYRLAPLARSAYPKRYDVLAAELIEVLVERHGSETALALVEEAARRLAGRAQTDIGSPVKETEREVRWASVLAWLEEEFDWEADLQALPGGRRRIVIHRCPFQDVSAERPAVCGRFFSTLLGILTGEEPVVHAPIGDGVRCCALEA